MPAYRKLDQGCRTVALEDTAILILSCDKYSDAWEPFFFFFFKFWPACPFPIYLGSNTLTYNDPRIITLAVGQTTDWSTGLARVLSRISESRIILVLEDYFLSSPVQEQTILDMISCAEASGAGYLRLIPIPGPDSPWQGCSNLGEIKPGSKYRTSLQAAWWKKSVLAELLVQGESPWEFELNGSSRSAMRSEPFLCAEISAGYPMDYYTTAIVRGKWDPGAVSMCEKYGVTLDFIKRPIATELLPKGRNWRKKLMARLIGFLRVR